MQRALFVVASALMLTVAAASFAPLALADTHDETSAAATHDPQKTDVTAKVSVPDVDVDVDNGGNGWVISPMWIVVGLLSVGVLVAIIIAASRGGSSGGTTVVK